MTFNEIKPLLTADEYIDIAIKKANREAAALKPKGDMLKRIKEKELRKLETIRHDLIGRLNNITNQFPIMKELIPLYKELVKITINEYDLRQALLSANAARMHINSFFHLYHRKIKSARDRNAIGQAKKSFYGRVSSAMKKVDLKFLRQARTALQTFPVIKSKYNQIAIAGFPNAGKSTLLSKLTKSRPEIAAYPFTTKGIMIGYTDKTQLLDTPGTLNRFKKMNYIEQQAFLIMKMVADKIIFVFDLTESYPIEDQIKLYKKVKEFKKPILVYLSKIDIMHEEDYKEFAKKYHAIPLKELKDHF